VGGRKKRLCSFGSVQEAQLAYLSKAEDKSVTHIVQDAVRMYVANARRQYPSWVIPDYAPLVSDDNESN
jgi:hypothetical protein